MCKKRGDVPFRRSQTNVARGKGTSPHEERISQGPEGSSAFIQQIMEEEVTELLGRDQSARQCGGRGARATATDTARLAMSSGTITLRRPRVGAGAESRVLPVIREADEGALELLHGLAEGDFELAMQGPTGRGGCRSRSETGQKFEWSRRSSG